MKAKIAVVYGLGGAIFDPASGERYMVTRLKGIGVDTGDSPYGYTDSASINQFLKDADWRGVIGDSFGASYMPSYVTGLEIDYIAGFQPSVYASDVVDGNEIFLPGNIKYAHCFRDPNWIDTGGLGYGIWVATFPKQTKVLVTEHRGAHPDDWGTTQDIAFNEVKQMLEAKK